MMIALFHSNVLHLLFGRVLIWSLWVPFLDAEFGSFWPGDVDLFLAIYDECREVYRSAHQFIKVSDVERKKWFVASVVGCGVDVDCCSGGVKDGNDCGMTVENTGE
uniref:Uncharacterized protein n=1 Tax=Tanacetum cinerariifolium TaxID=118510 RepID=A0A699IP62_TANCI|nr:hypothetical protein [Tanacetum cinerariifolium]